MVGFIEDMCGNLVKVGDKVAYQHKKYKSTTPTLSTGTVVDIIGKSMVLIEDDFCKISYNGYKQRKKHFVKL